MGTKPQPAPLLLITTPGEAFHETFQVTFLATGTVYQCPPFRVQAGMVVLIQPINGALVNAAPCFIGDRPNLLGSGASTVLPAGADVAINWNCRSTGEIYASGVIGDGILVTVAQAAFG